MARKTAALDLALPGWRHAAQRPRFVEGKPLSLPLCSLAAPSAGVPAA